MSFFDVYIGIDYSGRDNPEKPLSSIQVCLSAGKSAPHFVENPFRKSKHWSRTDLARWLDQTLEESKPVVVGIDHAFSFPQSYFGEKGLRDWDAFLRHFERRWATRVKSVQDAMPNPKPYPSREFRLTEKWTSSAKSVFQLDGIGAVGKSTHAGLPWLLDLRKKFQGRVHFWPFDGFSGWERKSVVAEVYPSIFRKRYREVIQKEFKEMKLSTDMQDAAAVCLWLKEFDQRDLLTHYFNPPLTTKEQKCVIREGWILGII